MTEKSYSATSVLRQAGNQASILSIAKVHDRVQAGAGERGAGPHSPGTGFTYLRPVEQAGNPNGSGTTSRRIGNASHDTGTAAQVCSGQMMRTGDGQFVLPVPRNEITSRKKGATHRLTNGSAEGLTLALMSRVLARDPDEMGAPRAAMGAAGIILRAQQRRRQRMYYRVALYQSAIQVNPPPAWQWKSTVLSELSALIQFLRLHRALPQDRLRVFSSSSEEDLDEQLVRENQGLGSTSVTAAQFLQERLIRSPEVTPETPDRDEGADRRWQPSLMGAIAARSQPTLQEHGRTENSLVGTGMSSLERRRLEHEHGAGGDHDVPYHFALPLSLPQVLAWTRLLGRRERGELEP